MSAPEKLIVLRFSAMGDVAMVASVLKELTAQNPQLKVLMVSRKNFEPFFKNITNVSFHAIYPKERHKGFLGLYRLFKELNIHKVFAVTDLHDNIRSRILSLFFRLSGVKIKRIDKGRFEKKALTRAKNKILQPLKLTVERYADTFRSLGFQIKLSHQLHKTPTSLPQQAIPLFENNNKKIGVAPFAQHVYKMYPFEKMEKVIDSLIKLGYQVFIFGGGHKEFVIAEAWQQKFPVLVNTIKKFTLNEELDIIANLDLMLSMDSSGMHMASLVGTPVISIWGPTHPYAGFLGYGQSINDCLQIDHPNRPNSIYGNKPCVCGIEECIAMITPQMIVEKINRKLNG
jgi:ADP-heptose:LPS heptosyltransferase